MLPISFDHSNQESPCRGGFGVAVLVEKVIISQGGSSLLMGGFLGTRILMGIVVTPEYLLGLSGGGWGD